MIKYPFEATVAELSADLEPYVDAVFSCLGSEFMVMPKGPGFVEYGLFEHGYEALKSATAGFSDLCADSVYSAAMSTPISIVVLRTMLGLTPPEWAYVTGQRTGLQVPQGFVRALDRRVRLAPTSGRKPGALSQQRLRALIETACQMLAQGVPSVEAGQVHRLEKADTKLGAESIRNLAAMGVPYAMLLYERFLGRPFAGHRDSVSELIGDSLESAVEEMLSQAGISFRKTKRAERIEGFDQAPDFIVPSEFNPQVVIEVKITEDDGTARDKVTRIQHLAELGHAGPVGDRPRFELIACIGGRGFGVRREDMKKLILATRGKVFTENTLHQMASRTRLAEFASRRSGPSCVEV